MPQATFYAGAVSEYDTSGSDRAWTIAPTSARLQTAEDSYASENSSATINMKAIICKTFTQEGGLTPLASYDSRAIARINKVTVQMLWKCDATYYADSYAHVQAGKIRLFSGAQTFNTASTARTQAAVIAQSAADDYRLDSFSDWDSPTLITPAVLTDVDFTVGIQIRQFILVGPQTTYARVDQVLLVIDYLDVAQALSLGRAVHRGLSA